MYVVLFRISNSPNFVLIRLYRVYVSKSYFRFDDLLNVYQCKWNEGSEGGKFYVQVRDTDSLILSVIFAPKTRLIM